MECAKIAKALNDEREAGNYTLEAADFWMKSDQKDRAVQIFKELTENFKKSGNFDQAGNVYKKIGEFYENLAEFELANTYYLYAIDMFALSKFKTTEATKLRIKVADLNASMTEKPESLKQAIKVC